MRRGKRIKYSDEHSDLIEIALIKRRIVALNKDYDAQRKAYFDDRDAGIPISDAERYKLKVALFAIYLDAERLKSEILIIKGLKKRRIVI